MPSLLGHPTTGLLGRDARRLKLDTLVRLRWLAVTGQSAAVSLVHFELGYKLPFGACLAVIAAAAAVNLWLGLRWPASHRLGEDLATFLLAFDILQLAALLYLTGGLQNPFSVLFLAPVLISAASLTPSRTLGLGLLAASCATLLVFNHRTLPWAPAGGLELPSLYVMGIWTAILLGIAFTGIFAYRIAEEARQLSAALAATELVLAREQHLSQLDGLAAAAAHELGTPLATIALVAKELDLQAPAGSALKEDTTLLREQVERCRSILATLTSLGDEEGGGGFLASMTLRHLIEEVVSPQRAVGVAVDVSCSGNGPEPVGRRSPGLIYGLGNLVDNAADFAESRIRIEANWTAHEVSVDICDDGPGFRPEVLLRVGEPYVTTRGRNLPDDETGSGLGLGLFIAKTLIERSGGQLTFSNALPPGRGAVARIVWLRTSFEEKTAITTTGSVFLPLTEAESVPI